MRAIRGDNASYGEEVSMTRTRLTGAAGLVFGIAFFLLGMFGLSTPDNGGAGAPARFVSFWQSSSHQSQALWTGVACTYLTVLLLLFIGGLRGLLRSVDAGPLPGLVAMLGTAAAVLVFSGVMLLLAVGITSHESHGFKVDGNTALVFDNVSYGIAAIGLMSAGAAAVCTSLVVRRTRVLPMWTAWVGFLAGLPALGSVFTAWVDFVLLPLWTVVVGIALLMVKADMVPAAAVREPIGAPV